jgi:parvulin-like peptidyl-prolyl isomerase
VPVSDSAFFTEAQPDPALEKIPALATTAFKLTRDLPNSDVVEGPNGYYVLHLASAVPSRQLSFDEAKQKVIAQMRKDRATQMMQTSANQVRDRILAGLKAGKSFSEAAIGAGVPAENLPPFSLEEASKLDVPDLQAIVQNCISLGDGQISEFIPTESGGLFIYVNGRQVPDKNAFVMGEDAVKEQVIRQKDAEAFAEWLRLRKDSARLQIVQR